MKEKFIVLRKIVDFDFEFLYFIVLLEGFSFFEVNVDEDVIL